MAYAMGYRLGATSWLVAPQSRAALLVRNREPSSWRPLRS